MCCELVDWLNWLILHVPCEWLTSCCLLPGQRLQTLSLPAMKTTSCCFGGPDYSELFVTSASLGVDQSELQKQPQAGNTFRVSTRPPLPSSLPITYLLTVTCTAVCLCPGDRTRGQRSTIPLLHWMICSRRNLQLSNKATD